MSNPRTVPSAGAKDVATFTIMIDGEAISRTVEVSAITTFKSIGKIPFARVEIFDGDPAKETFAQSESDQFAQGNEIEINVGYRSEEDLIFKGVIVAQKIRVRPDGRGLLTLVCRHALYTSTLTQRSRTYLESTDADAVSAALGDYDVSLDAASTSVTHESLVQYQASNWDFALTRAEANGLFLIPTDEGASLAEPDLGGSSVLDLIFGATLLELDLEQDIRNQPTEVTATSWDPAAQEIIESTGEEPTLPTTENQAPTDLSSFHGQSAHFQHPSLITQEELDAFTSAALLTQRLTLTTGRARCTGTPLPLPGTIINLGGLGARFNGDYLVSAVRHNIIDGKWTTDIQVGLPNPNLSSLNSPDSAPVEKMVPAIHGLHIGVVQELEGDPASEFRVLISIPALGETAEPIWARLKTLDAGENRGSFFYPEVSDEVIVAFLNDDPRHAVILGSLHSSTHTAPLEPSNDNHEKGYFSRGEMKFLFNDDLNSVLLETPAGNKLELSEDSGGITLEDENGNKLVMDSDGIVIESASDLTLQASGDITLGATNITAEADSQFTGSGSSGAEISASGNTVVKGALVQIN